MARCFFLAMTGLCAVRAQQVSTIGAAGFPNLASLPHEFRNVASALGDRLQVAGKERMTISGTMNTSGATFPVTVTFQLPNNIRIDESRSQAISLGFDGNAVWASYGTPTAQDRNLMESLLDDAAETTLFSLSNGSALRTIAHRARLASSANTIQYTGSWADIYEMIGQPYAQPKGTNRQKHHYFDCETMLPLMVRYQIMNATGAAVLVQTSTSAWTKFSGESVPGTITRTEASVTVFTLSVTGAVFSPAASDGFFSH
jgi:hypothetical protein